ESSVSAARPPIELVLDVPGGQTYPRDLVLALGGRSTSSSRRTAGGPGVCCKAAHRAGGRRFRGPDVPERLGARPGGEEHQLVHAAAGELSVCCKAAPSSWCSTFPGARRTRETRCSPWEG